MIDHFLSALKEHVNAMLRAQPVTRIGVVTSYSPADHTLKALIQPEGITTTWCPIASPSVGALSVVIPPIPGQQVVLQPDSGDAQSYIAVGLLHDVVDTPGKAAAAFGATPANASPGEMLIRGPGGFSLLIGQDGSVNIVATQVRIDVGDLHVAHDIYDRHGSLDRLRQNYNAHMHTGVAKGSDTSAATTIVDPE